MEIKKPPETALAKSTGVEVSSFKRTPQKYLSERFAEVVMGIEVPDKLPGWVTGAGGVLVTGAGLTAVLAWTWFKGHAIQVLGLVSILLFGLMRVLIRGMKQAHQRLLGEVDEHTRKEVEKAIQHAFGQYEGDLNTAAETHAQELARVNEARVAELATARASGAGWEKNFKDQQQANIELNANIQSIQRAHFEETARWKTREAKLEAEVNELQKLLAKHLLPPLPPPEIHPKWWRRDWIELWEAVSLAGGRDPELAFRGPDGLPDARRGHPEPEDMGRGENPNIFKKHFDEALSHLGSSLPGDLPGKRVRLAVFANWAINRGWKVAMPPEFLKLGEAVEAA